MKKRRSSLRIKTAYEEGEEEYEEAEESEEEETLEEGSESADERTDTAAESQESGNDSAVAKEDSSKDRSNYVDEDNSKEVDEENRKSVKMPSRDADLCLDSVDLVASPEKVTPTSDFLRKPETDIEHVTGQARQHASQRISDPKDAKTDAKVELEMPQSHQQQGLVETLSVEKCDASASEDIIRSLESSRDHKGHEQSIDSFLAVKGKADIGLEAKANEPMVVTSEALVSSQENPGDARSSSKGVDFESTPEEEKHFDYEGQHRRDGKSVEPCSISPRPGNTAYSSSHSKGKSSTSDRETSNRILRECSFTTATLEPMFSRISTERRHWIDSVRFDIFLRAAILVNSVLLGIEISLGLPPSLTDLGHVTLFVLQVCFLLLFILELGFRLKVVGPKRFFKTLAYLFDLAIVLITTVDLCILTPGSLSMSFKSLRGFQLLRLLRVGPSVIMSSDFSLLLHGLMMSIKSAFWVCLLLFLIIYNGALFCSYLLVDGQEESGNILSFYFGSVGSSIFTHFKIFTLEAWPTVIDESMNVSGWTILYFIPYVLVTNLVVVNLLVGAIVTRTAQLSIEARLGRGWQDNGSFYESLWRVLATEEFGKEGWITRDEFRKFFAKPHAKAVLQAFDVPSSIDLEMCFDILGGCHALQIETVLKELTSMCVPHELVHALHGRRDIFLDSDMLEQRIVRLGDALEGTFRNGAGELEQNFDKHLTSISNQIGEITREVSQKRANDSTRNGKKHAPTHFVELLDLMHRAAAKTRHLNGLVAKVGNELEASLAQERILEEAVVQQKRMADVQEDCDHVATQVASAAAVSRRRFPTQPTPQPNAPLDDVESVLE